MENERNKDPTEPKQKTEVQTIPLAKIHDLPGAVITKQPDKNYGGLVSSIQAGGVTEPVILRQREDGEYQLLAGYRRRRACELAKKTEMPALVYDMTLQQAMDYHRKQKLQANTPVPGKLVIPQSEADKPKTEEKAEIPDEEKAIEDKLPAEDTKGADRKAEPKLPKETQEANIKQPVAPYKPEKPAVEEKAKQGPKAEKKAAEPPKAAPAPGGPAAVGPMGTAITQVFDDRLNPPTEHDLKDLPSPKEGESFFITLHPGYLEKSKFNNFSVEKDSENFKELRKSVELVGIKDPVLARLKPEGGLEILSGQRRHLAASELNYPVPTIIQKIEDDDAKIIVADGNLHRDKITTFDLSRALKMKMEGMKRKAGRRKKSDPTVPKLDTDEAIAKEMGMTVSKLNRIIRLSEASKEVCDRVDDGSLALSIASAISFLKPKNQDKVMHMMDLGYKVSNDRIERMKKVEKAGVLDERMMRDILDDKDLAPKPVTKPVGVITGSAKISDLQKTTAKPVPASPPPLLPAEMPPAPPPESVPSVPINAAAEVPAAAAQNDSQKAPAEKLEVIMSPVQKSGEVHVQLANSGKQDRPEYTKVVLAGDRLRKYFPDVSMTPREIEDSVYEALEERRQRQEKVKAKDELFKKKPGPER